MRPINKLLILPTLALIACASVLIMAGAGDQPATAPATPPATKEKPVTPDPTAAVLAELKSTEGAWDVQATFWLRPGMEPIKTSATMTSRMILSGMFLEQSIEGGSFGPAMGNKPWSSRSITGFNASTGMLEVVRFGCMTSVMIPVKGKYAAGDKRSEVSGTYQMMGMNCSERDVTIVDSPDRHTVECYMKFGDMPEFKGAELVVTRKK